MYMYMSTYIYIYICICINYIQLHANTGPPNTSKFGNFSTLHKPVVGHKHVTLSHIWSKMGGQKHSIHLVPALTASRRYS